ncbi:MAG: hypothetical protein Kapaf2KO_03320 [Candidatus Kapaibacteriales bacterium]
MKYKELNSICKVFALFISVLVFGHASAQIIISEFQPAPSSPEPEWVELVNIGNVDYVCSDCELGDSGTLRGLPEFTLSTGQYAVVSKDTLELKAKYNLPETVILIQVSLPAFNNTTDEVRLYDDENLLDSLAYDMKDYERDLSIERIDLTKPFDENNRGSTVEGTGTPGRENSLRPKEYDFEAKIVNQSFSQLGFTAELRITSSGTKPMTVSGYTLDGFGTYSDMIFTPNPEVLPNDSISLSISSTAPYLLGYGSYDLSLILLDEAAQRLDSINISSDIFFNEPPTEPYITEVMFEPEDGRPEFIEVYNPNQTQLSISKYRLGDASDRDLLPEIMIDAATSHRDSSDLFIEPEGYLALTTDSTFTEYPQHGKYAIITDFPSLNNDRDDLYLMLDSIPAPEIIPFIYTIDMHDERLSETKGISLEMVDEKSGKSTLLRSSSSSSGSTPGQPNTWSWVGGDTGTITIEPNPIGADTEAEIRYTLFQNSPNGYIRAVIYDENLTQVKLLEQGAPSNGSGVFYWDGRDESGKKLPIGIYVLQIETQSSPGLGTEIFREMIVIGE